MSECKIEHLRQKSAQNLSDEEVLDLLKNDIETMGEVPVTRDLRADSPWSVTEGLVDRAAGSLSNALWLLGEEPNHETRVVDGDTEIAEHELRGLEHDLGRPPKPSESKGVYTGYDEGFRKEAGIPYHALSVSGAGTIDPERQKELVKMLFVDQKDPKVLERNHELKQSKNFEDDERAARYEIGLISEAYCPWIDETTETPQDESGYEIDSEEELIGVVLELVGEEALSQREIAAELDMSEKGVKDVFSFLKNKELIESEYGGRDGKRATGQRTFLTEQGREFLTSDDYGTLFDKEEIDIAGFKSPYSEQAEEFPGEFDNQGTAEILELLAEGYETQEEIAEELGYASQSLRPYIEELERYGLINSRSSVGTWLTERGEEVYEQHIDEGSEHLTEGSSEEKLEPDREPVDEYDRDLENAETLADIYSALGTEASIEIFDLLNQGHSRREIAQETGRSYGGLQNYMDKYKELGWIESGPGRETKVTEVGKFFYKKLLEDDQVIDSVCD